MQKLSVEYVNNLNLSTYDAFLFMLKCKFVNNNLPECFL